MADSIQFGSRKISYVVKYSNRKTLGITVTPEMQVQVNAPLSASPEKVAAMVIKKAPWIIKQLNYFLPFHPKTPARRYINGETHLYLGRQYQLKITVGKTDLLSFKGRYMQVQHKPNSKPADIIKVWYKERAKRLLPEIAEPLIQQFAKYGVEPSSIYLYQMPTRWGSCSPKGRILLNPELLQAPKGCIEYVIIHELCHLVHRYHNDKFFQLQSQHMPDWEKWKQRLEKLLA